MQSPNAKHTEPLQGRLDADAGRSNEESLSVMVVRRIRPNSGVFGVTSKSGNFGCAGQRRRPHCEKTTANRWLARGSVSTIMTVRTVTLQLTASDAASLRLRRRMQPRPDAVGFPTFTGVSF